MTGRFRAFLGLTLLLCVGCKDTVLSRSHLEVEYTGFLQVPREVLHQNEVLLTRCDRVFGNGILLFDRRGVVRARRLSSLWKRGSNVVFVRWRSRRALGGENGPIDIFDIVHLEHVVVGVDFGASSSIAARRPTEVGFRQSTTEWGTLSCVFQVRSVSVGGFGFAAFQTPRTELDRTVALS